MKQALVLLIILTLFSFMTGLQCSSEEIAVYVDFNIKSCRCGPKDLGGYFAIRQECQLNQKPTCIGDLTSIKCYCQS